MTALDDVTNYGDPLEARAVTCGNLLFVTPGLAHDIGNCLQAASLHLELLKMTLRDAEGAEQDNASTIALSEQLLRIHQLVSVLVEITAPVVAEPVIFDVRELASEITHLLRVVLRHRGISPHLCLGQAELWVRGDRTALLHTCLVLMISVTEATPYGGDLYVTCDSGKSGFARVRIGDAGGGVPEDLATKMFDVGATKREGHADLGLSFSLRVIRHHQGRLLSANESDGGSSFFFELPLLPET